MDNCIKDPIEFAANLALSTTANAIKEFEYRKDQQKIRYNTRMERYLDLKEKGQVDPDFDPDFCEECGAEMPQVRKDNYEVLCTLCKTAQEKVKSRYR